MRRTQPALIERNTMSKDARRRSSRIVHDHKGTATVEWVDAPANYERQPLSLTVQTDESHNPYMRIPEAERKRPPGQRTDLRKLSAWIKMMRSLEEAKKNRDDE
jgi:hypothetical protein